MGTNKICICGTENPETSKFCRECGYMLPQSKTDKLTDNSSEWIKQLERKNNEKEPINVYPDVEGLRQLVCLSYKQTSLAMGGNSYNELMLYYNGNNGEYQVHKCYQRGNATKRKEGYYVSKAFAEEMIELIKQDKIDQIEASGIMPAGGGEASIVYANDDGSVSRFTCGNGPLLEEYYKLCKKLGEGVVKENRIVPEYAKNWKKVVVNSTGMSMDSCFNFEIVREDDKIKYCGSFFNNGKKIMADWTYLDSDKTMAILKVPVGLLISNVQKNSDNMVMGVGLGMGINPALGMGMMGVMACDQNVKSIQVTYSDDRTDSKIADDDVLGELFEILTSSAMR